MKSIFDSIHTLATEKATNTMTQHDLRLEVFLEVFL